MTTEEFRAFIDKSELPISVIARGSGVGRTQVSYFANDFKEISWGDKMKIKNFMEEYKLRWRD